MPAAARRPPAVPAEGPDLSLRMDAQLPPHRPRFQIQDLVGAPLVRHHPQRAAVRAARKPGPTQGGQLPRRAETQTLALRIVARDRPAQQTVRTAGQERQRGLSCVPGPPLPSRPAVEEGIDGPCGQRGELPAAAQVPQAGAFVHAHGQQATVRAEVAVVVAAPAGTPAADQGAVFAARRHFQQLGLLAVRYGPQPPAIAAESRTVIDREGQLQQRPSRRRVPEPQDAVPGVRGQEAPVRVERQRP